MKEAKEKKVYGFGIAIRHIVNMQSMGYKDINEYIDAIINTAKQYKEEYEKLKDHENNEDNKV